MDDDKFDEAFYLNEYPHVRIFGIEPRDHYRQYGMRLGYLPFKGAKLPKVSKVAPKQAEKSLGTKSLPKDKIAQSDFDTVVTEIDLAWYNSLFPKGKAPKDPVAHYLETGWQEGMEPTPWFSSRHYLATYEDVGPSGMNPFVHYLKIGKYEGRHLPLRASKKKSHAIHAYAAHAHASAPGSLFEEFDATIGAGKTPLVKALAYYLPQYHAFAENDKFWGKGFTEWRNVMRGMPRFEGHLQPRIPRDLGFYSLDHGNVLQRQFDMAKQAGIHGFCFYHYWFDGKRVMEKPVERLLADKSLDIPFSILWANENWSRTWDGAEATLLLKQSYNAKDDVAFVDDLARHFKDERYIKIDNRPVFYIYRAGHIPDTKGTIGRWRDLLAKRHKLDPLFFMVQSFDDVDPADHGFDGAIEFPPHKILKDTPVIQSDLRMIDPDFTGLIVGYDNIVRTAMKQRPPDFPLIRAVLPSWDNDARRPGRSTIIAGSTPKAFGAWTRWAISQAKANPVMGQSFIGVNAWNEWAEGTYLEPDTHYGAAYLNEFARAMFGAD